jgi:hypothetical protein
MVFTITHSSAKATRTFSPLSQPISKPEEHQRRSHLSTAISTVVPPLNATGMANIETRLLIDSCFECGDTSSPNSALRPAL